jgi:hypothetical protein
MNDLVESLMYHSGMTASGCWDELDDYDRAAIERLVELVARECMTICVANALQEADSEGKSSSAKSALDIKEAFGVQ